MYLLMGGHQAERIADVKAIPRRSPILKHSSGATMSIYIIGLPELPVS